LSRRAQWGVILAGYFGNRILGSVADANPALAPWILPLRILYVTFVLLTWIAVPIFNLMLRLNRFGRLALSREQVVASNWIGGCLLLALLALAGCLFYSFDSPFVLAALVFGFLVIPLAGTFRCCEGWPRKIMAIYTGVMAATGLGGLLIFCADAYRYPNTKAPPSIGITLIGLFFLGAIGSAWVANILISQRPRR